MADGDCREHPDFLSKQLITCLGNKRALLGPIEAAVEKVKRRLGRERISFFDLFSGSGVVSRLMKAHASHIIANDLEAYATVASRCFLSNRSDVDLPALADVVADLNDCVALPGAPCGFIAEMYAPHDEENITANDRVFYTRANACRLDAYRQLIEKAPAHLRDFLLAPLISAASIHANTAGVFKGFYKNRQTGIGQFGGTGSDALQRIRGEIRLEPPILSRFECPFEVFQADAHAAAIQARPVDLAYLDPPYNQHPYGSNYFLLNLLVRYERPERVSRVSGIPEDWNRSAFNVRGGALATLEALVQDLRATFLLVSFNNEGFIAPADMHRMLAARGKVEEIEIPYPAFRGSRSFANRSTRVTEHLFLVERR
jgi:adenine-specific DNA-methyltransferase